MHDSAIKYSEVHLIRLPTDRQYMKFSWLFQPCSVQPQTRHSQHKMSINSNTCRPALYDQIYQIYSSGKYRLYTLQAMFQITEVNLISKKLF